jgi:hypothetical protein
MNKDNCRRRGSAASVAPSSHSCVRNGELFLQLKFNREWGFTMYPWALGFMLALGVGVLDCTLFQTSSKDTFKIIELEEFYDVDSAILPDTLATLFKSQTVTGIDLSVDQVRQAEYILNSDYVNFLNRMYAEGRFELPIQDRLSNSKLDTLALLVDFSEKALTGFRQYHRQYSGLLDKRGHVIVLIRMFKIDDSDSQLVFGNWKKEVLEGADGIFATHFTRFGIDLSTKAIID